MRCTGATRSSSGHGGDMVSGGRSSAATELWPRACKREGKERGSARRLTARSMSSSVVSGRRRRRRIDRGVLRWPATETVMVAALQRVRDLVARWRGRGGRGGVRGNVQSVRASRERGRQAGGVAARPCARVGHALGVRLARWRRRLAVGPVGRTAGLGKWPGILSLYLPFSNISVFYYSVNLGLY